MPKRFARLFRRISGSGQRSVRLKRYFTAYGVTRAALVVVILVAATVLVQAQQTQTVFGTLSGYTGSSPLLIYSNGVTTPAASLTSDGVFSFVPNNLVYHVTITSQPAGQNCTIFNNGNGQVGDGTWVVITCNPINFSPPPTSTSWKRLIHDAPVDDETLILLSDGTVMINGPAVAPQQWWRLTPDSTGHYVNGTWSQLTSSKCPHGDFASQVLRDGTVFVAGGEYPEGVRSSASGCSGPNQSNSGVDTEIFNPVANGGMGSWTMADPPKSLIDPTKPSSGYTAICGFQAFADMTSDTLPDGSVLMAPVCPKHCGDTLIYNPTTGWAPAAAPLANTGNTWWTCDQEETTWVKLRDGSILSADPPAQIGGTQTSERYVPSVGWVKDSPLGFSLFDTEFGYSDQNGWHGEEGPAFLLPNGNALFVGGSTTVGTYTPASPPPGSPAGPGGWTQANIAPNGPATGGVPMSADDTTGATMMNGKILVGLNFAAIPGTKIPWPTFFFEYDPTVSTFTEVAGPGDPGAPSVWSDCFSGGGQMLDLPDGTVLTFSLCDNTHFYVYQPSGTPLPLGQPTINAVTTNANGSYHLTGTGLTGISEGGAILDDSQTATNFPLVRLTGTKGDVHYARTFNWSGTGVAPGAQGSTDFTLPIGLSASTTYSLQVVVNGNASASYTFSSPPLPPPPPINCKQLLVSVGLNPLRLTQQQRNVLGQQLYDCVTSNQITQFEYETALHQLENP